MEKVKCEIFVIAIRKYTYFYGKGLDSEMVTIFFTEVYTHINSSTSYKLNLNNVVFLFLSLLVGLACPQARFETAQYSNVIKTCLTVV